MVDVSAVWHFDPVIALKNIASQFEMTFVPRGAIQFNQSKLDFRMTGEDRLFVRPETEIRKQKAVDKTDSGVQEGAIACCAVIGNRTLKKVAEVVQLMAPSLNFRGHAILSAVTNVIGVQVSAGLLNRDNLFDDLICHGAQLGKIGGLKRETRRFGPFVDIGIGEYRPTLRSVALARQAQEIVHPAVSLEQFFHGRDALLDVRLASSCPEARRDGYRVDGHVPQLGVRRLDEVQHTLILPFGTPRGSGGRYQFAFTGQRKVS